MRRAGRIICRLSRRLWVDRAGAGLLKLVWRKCFVGWHLKGTPMSGPTGIFVLHDD